MMKSPRSRTVISVSLVLLLLAFLSGCQTESQPPLNYTGSGTASNPHVISDAQALVRVANIITDSYTYSDNAQLGAYVELGADIDMNDITETESGNWTPIGTYDEVAGKVYSFTGTFSGNGHEIRNLKIHLPDTDYGGLFGYTRNATIQDVNLVNADVEGQSSVGALIGYAESTDISRCSSDGTVSGQEYVVGGLVGEIDAGSLSFCSSFSIVSSYGISGGLVGAVSSGAVVSSCYATGEVRVEVRREGDGSSGGGLIGFSQGSSTDWVTVSSCYATGNVSTADDHAGGLIGYVDNTEIENCYASGDVSGTSYVGGLVGRAANNTVVTFSYATGAVTAEIGYAGGLVGCADKTTTTIRDSFAANGTIIFTGEDATPTFHRVAGFSYTNQLTNLYANVAMAVGNVTVTTESNASGVDGDSKSITEDFQSIAFFSDTQWTDADAWSTDVWTFSDDDYPHLNWEG